MTRKNLIQKAKEAGMQIIERNGHCEIIKTGRGATSVRFYEDGAILRSDVRLDLATKMTVKSAAHVLGLN